MAWGGSHPPSLLAAAPPCRWVPGPAPPPPPGVLYIVGGGGVHPPQGTSEVPSPFRTLPLSYLLAHGPLGAGSLGPYRPRRTPHSPCGPPPGLVDPLVDPRTPFGTPGTIPIKCETFPATKIRLPIYKSLPPDHSGTPRDVRDLIRDSEQLSGYRILISL